MSKERRSWELWQLIVAPLIVGITIAVVIFLVPALWGSLSGHEQPERAPVW